MTTRPMTSKALQPKSWLGQHENCLFLSSIFYIKDQIIHKNNTFHFWNKLHCLWYPNLDIESCRRRVTVNKSLDCTIAILFLMTRGRMGTELKRNTGKRDQVIVKPYTAGEEGHRQNHKKTRQAFLLDSFIRTTDAVVWSVNIQTKRFSALIYGEMQHKIVSRVYATLCARWRCFECSIWKTHRISVGKTTCL